MGDIDTLIFVIGAFSTLNGILFGVVACYAVTRYSFRRHGLVVVKRKEFDLTIALPEYVVVVTYQFDDNGIKRTIHTEKREES
jgi:ABC-type sulfate transport system permease component